MGYNTLLMGLSTFNGGYDKDSGITTISKWNYVATKENGKVEKRGYYYQMEPVIYKLFDDLQAEGKQIDCIIALATNRALESRKLEFENGEGVIENGEYSPIGYLKKKYPNVEIIPIDIDLNEMSEGIINCASKLQELNRNKEDFRMWIDNHGSLREIAMIVQGIISLLKSEGIYPQAVFGCETDNAKREARVLKADAGFEINDFVSGVNEFLNSGRGKQLLKYLEDEVIVTSVNKISDSILLCNMDSFEENIDELYEHIVPGKASQKDYMDLFVEFIKADYGVLLEPGRRTIIDAIKWCLKKDLIQQALTLVESKMPGMIVGSKYFRVDWNSSRSRKIKKPDAHGQWCYQTDGSVTVGEAIDYAKNDWESRENGILRLWAMNKDSNVLDYDRDDTGEVIYVDGRPKILYLPLSSNMGEKDERSGKYGWEDLVPSTQTMSFSYRQNFKIRNESGGGDENCRCKVVINHDSIPAKDLCLFNLFMKLHMSLKNLRNQVNHGAGGMSLDTTVSALNAYVRIAELLFL